jgi:23S rRNA pseudouridine1911/1915/1917 synthase
LRMPAGCSEELKQMLRGFKRQALHAMRLGLEHPVSGEWMEWQVPVPEDMSRLIEMLRRDRDNG